MNFEILTGDNRETLKTLADNSVDAIVTDPPYGIDFLGKAWDANTGAVETYAECLRVLKPGGHILAFSAARTYHHLAVTLEQAGFEIRDQLMWLYGSGFPKAQDIGKGIQKRQGVEKTIVKDGANAFGSDGQINFSEKTETFGEKKGEVVPTSPEALEWAGWKTALKPAHEPICMARKPFKGSTIDNVLTHGVGALNIDATRIETDEQIAEPKRGKGVFKEQECGWNKDDYNGEYKSNQQGRFPSNVIGEVEGYQKYFYCPKVSRKERHIGFEQLPDRLCGPGGEEWVKAQEHQRSNENKGNNHPTVKPVALMKYLIKLVAPANSVVLDPFNGSGSTGMAAVELGHTYIGCELDPAYVDIATRRITAWNTPEHSGTTFEELFSVKED